MVSSGRTGVFGTIYLQRGRYQSNDCMHPIDSIDGGIPRVLASFVAE
jgi:hypothetical protein